MDKWIQVAMDLGATEAGWLDTGIIRFLPGGAKDVRGRKMRRLWEKLGMSAGMRIRGGVCRTGEVVPARAGLYRGGSDGRSL